MRIVDKKEKHYWELKRGNTMTKDSLVKFLQNYSDAELVRKDTYGFS